MVTVKQFLDAGFDLVEGDSVNNDGCSFILNSEELVERWNTRSLCDERRFVNGVVWRKNEGFLPVDDDCLVEIEHYNGDERVIEAGCYCWDNDYCLDTEIYAWRPSLKHLKKQMNDNQETKTALEMSERDIENYSDNCDVEREPKESDEVTWENGELCDVEKLEGKHQFGCDVPNSDLVIVFCCESGAPSTVNKDRLMKIVPLEEKNGQDLFCLHKASIMHAHLFSAYDSEWNTISDKCKKYWIHFAKQLGFTTGI